MAQLSFRMRSILLVLLSLTSAALFAACAPVEDDGELPTLFILPTLTPSDTPSATFTPSPEPPTATPQPTATFTATSTPTRTLTPTIAATATFTLAPATLTPTPTDDLDPDALAPRIIRFVASSLSAAAGSQVTLTWEVIGEEVRLEQLDQTGTVVNATPLELAGSIQVVIPTGQGNQVNYRLVVFGGEVELTQVVTVNIALSCAINWFFGNEFVPPNAGCPTGAAESGPGAFQTFQGGVMIYVNANNRNTVYALANQGAANNQVTQNLYSATTVNWDITLDTCGGRVPPAGLFLPAQMFNNMACGFFGPAGFWIDTVGFATGPIDTSNRTIQFEQSGAFYIDSPIGRVYRFTPIGPGILAAPWSQVR